MAKMAGDSVIDWLLAGDAAIRFQTLRDLAGASERTWRREQRCVATTGWGARLLALQDEDGRWGRGIYTPKWTSTTYTLLLLRDLGLAPGNAQALRACRLLLDEGFWSDGGINFYPRWAKCSETCITAMALAVSRWFGLDDPRIALLRSTCWQRRCPTEAELPRNSGIRRRDAQLFPHNDFGTGSAARVARCYAGASARRGVSAGSPPVSQSPYRRNRQSRLHPLPLSPALALRRPPSSRLLPRRGCNARSAPPGRHRIGPCAEAIRRSVASGERLSRQGVL